MAETIKHKFLYAILYPYLGGLYLNHSLKKTKHKVEQEAQMKYDYIDTCFRVFRVVVIILLVVISILNFIDAKTKNKNSGFLIFLCVLLMIFVGILSFFISCVLRSVRKNIIENICGSCGEYKNWKKDKKLVNKKDELEEYTVYRDSILSNRKGEVIGTISTPISKTRTITHLTYKVSKECKCCGKVYSHFVEEKE